MSIETFRYVKIGEAYKTAVLSNGLKVIIVEKPGFRAKNAVFAVNYGGADVRFRTDGKLHDTPAGIAHYLEHKMFDMPEGDNALNILTSNGADPNAYTACDITAYYFQCTEHFYENLRTLLRFVTTPYFTEETVEKERDIISQEIMMGRDNPHRTVYYNLLRLLYRNHPVSLDVAGTPESIREITADTLYRLHGLFYCPGNMVLTVEGDVIADDVIAAAEQELSGWQPSEVPSKEYGEDDGLAPYETFISVPQQISQTQFLLGAKVKVAEGDPTRQRLGIALALQVMYGCSSPFYSKLYSDGLINATFSHDIEYNAGTALITLGGETQDPDAVCREIMRVSEDVRQNGLNAERFERLKKASFGSALRGLEDFDSVCSDFADGVFRGYCPFDEPAIMDSLTCSECSAVISEFLAPERIAVSIITPQSSDA